MTMRTLLLTIHIAAVAGWLGADVLVHVVSPQLDRAGGEVETAWTRVQVVLHDRYYPIVAVILLASGIGLVQDGGWAWSSWFIWVGVGAIVVGASLGGGGVGSRSKRRLAALESGDRASAAVLQRQARMLGLVVTLAPVVAIVAMVHKWHAAF